MRSKLRNTDQAGRRIRPGDTVRIARTLVDHCAHPEFKKAFRLVAGSTKLVSSSDPNHGVTVRVGEWEVLTIEARRLRIVRMHARR